MANVLRADHLWSFGRSRKFGLWFSLRHATVHNPLKLEKKYIDMFTERSNKNQERLPYDDILVFKDIVSIFLDKSAVISYHYIHEILLLYFVSVYMYWIVINALVLLTINSLFILDSPNLLFIVHFTWIYIVIVNNFRIQVFGVLNAIIYQMTFPYSTNATILNTQQSS